MSNGRPPERLRLFVAVNLPEEIKSAIENAQADLRRALPRALARWTKREQFHLTLRFLGSVEAGRTEALAEALRGACHGFAPLRLRAERIGFFPDNRLPRVVWVGVHDDHNQLPGLQHAVETATQDFTAEEPEGRFTGHITLARIKGIRRHEAETLARAVAGMAEKFFGEWTADKVELMRSELSPKGAKYSILDAIPLQA